jgi:arylsulfatase
LLSLDTVRADRMVPEHMPWLAALASEGVLWENAWGQSWTPHGVGTILTGRTPADWGAESFDWEGGVSPARIDPGVPLLADQLTGLGWATAYWSANGMASIKTDLNRGYTDFEAVAEGTVVETAEKIVEWAAANEGRDQFFHLHVNDAHDPYTFQSEACATDVAALPLADCRYDWVSRDAEATVQVDHDLVDGSWGPESEDYEVCKTILTALYDCEVRYEDDVLKQSWQVLDEAGLILDTLVVVVADHGEGLLDPWANHGFDLRSQTTRNWVLIRWPGRVSPGTVTAPMGQDDIVPTIGGLLDVDLGIPTTGLPWWEAPEDRVVMAFWLGTMPTESTEQRRHSAVGAGYHYIRSSLGEQWLYDVAADPNEQDNLLPGGRIPEALIAAVDAQVAQTATYTNGL